MSALAGKVDIQAHIKLTFRTLITRLNGPS